MVAALMKQVIKRVPGAKRIYRYIVRRRGFEGSARYWEKRYVQGGNSGAGSYGRLAEYKARILNKFVAENGLRHIVELGCGDGNQLQLADYPFYSGYDVSPAAVARCRSLFASDSGKSFHLMDEYDGEIGDLSMSLDVIYHLVEDDVFERYMSVLFSASSRFVAIYSSCRDGKPDRHVRHRVFTDWVERNAPFWKLIEFKSNEFPLISNAKEESFSDFYFYEKGEI